MEEIWKTLDRNSNYQVSSSGHVRSLDRQVTDSLGRTRKYLGKVLNPSKDENGYLLVGISKDGHSKRVFVHRLVAETFIENPDDKPTVNHIDGNKENNKVDNLEWATYKENRDHAVRTGLLNLDKVRNHARSFSKPVKCIDTGQIFSSISDAARHYNVDTETIKYWINSRTQQRPNLEYVENR